jgi:pyrroline-5-carboxylate reductase
MCEAVVGGLIKNIVSNKDKICSSNPSTPRLEIMKQKFGTETFAGAGGNIEVVKRSKIIVLAVKPVFLKDVLNEIKEHLTSEHLVISIVAGVNIDTI